jgi:hypothetical protein
VFLRADSDEFAFASESELTSSPSDRLGDLEGMMDIVQEVKLGQTLILCVEVRKSVSESFLKCC